MNLFFKLFRWCQWIFGCAMIMAYGSYLSGCSSWTAAYRQQQTMNQALIDPYQFQFMPETSSAPAAFYVVPAKLLP